MRSAGGRAPRTDRASWHRRAGLELPEGGCWGGSFIELGEPGWSWLHSACKGAQGREAHSGLEERVPGPFHATFSSPNRGQGTRSRQSRSRDLVLSMSRLEHFPPNFQCILIEKRQGKCHLCFSFPSESHRECGSPEEGCCKTWASWTARKAVSEKLLCCKKQRGSRCQLLA